MNQFTFDFGDGFTEPEFTIAVGEQPQQRLEYFGVKAVSDTELLALILQGSGTRPERALAMASQLIAEAGSMVGLLSWDPVDYRRIRGIGHIKGLQLATVAEIARRMMMGPRNSAPLLDRPEHVAAHFAPQVAGLEIEKFWICLLNRKSRLIKQVEITSGTATAALAHPREVFRAALRERVPVTSLCAVHSHPSGDPAPSSQDVHLTRILREASKTVDVPLVDHVIVGRSDADPLGVGYYSFRQAGLI